MLTLAHFSDPHLSPLPEVKPWQLANKRVTGYLSWKLKRRKLSSRAVLDLLTDDIKTQNPAHVAITGDLVNISLPEEFINALAWLKGFGRPDWISVIPGNHDAYMRIEPKYGFHLWREFMTYDAQAAAFQADPLSVFPYIRLRKKIAFIGTSTAVTTPPFIARGTLGEAQIERLRISLTRLGEAGYFRILLIHHPPLPGLAVWRKALSDAQELEAVLKKAGVELVLHGHNHIDMHAKLETASGMAHIIGVPAASHARPTHKPVAAYNLYRITHSNDKWHCTLTKRAYDPNNHEIREIREVDLI